jgi:hypothetical protein
MLHAAGAAISAIDLLQYFSARFWRSQTVEQSCRLPEKSGVRKDIAP